jgi:chromosome segregation ATPase
MIRELFQKVKRKSQQRAGDAFSSYWQNVVARLAGGEDLDPEAVVQAAESVGRGPDEVEKDVALFQSRSRMVAELKQVPKWQAESARLQAVIDRQTAELNEVQARLGKSIAEAYESRKTIDAQIDSTRSYETDLARTCPNPELQSREQQLIAERKELLARRQPLIESISDSGPGSLGSALRHSESQLEDYSDLASRGDDDARRYIARLKETIQSYQTRIKQSQQQLSAIDEQLATLDRELTSIRQQKLIP